MYKAITTAALFICSLISFEVNATSLMQAAYVPGTTSYEFGFNSIPEIVVTGEPADIDKRRSAMLHDGDVYRLYFFKQGSSDTLYQFGYNPSTQAYEYGYRSIPVLTITGAPADASTDSFAMLHDGSTYRLYLKSASSNDTMYQFGFNRATQDYEFGFNSIPQLFITGAPSDADLDRWGMLHDGSAYRFYAFKSGVIDTLYQFSFNASTLDYEYGFNSIPVLDLDLIPLRGNKRFFHMLHDGSAYRFYFLRR